MPVLRRENLLTALALIAFMVVGALLATRTLAGYPALLPVAGLAALGSLATPYGLHSNQSFWLEVAAGLLVAAGVIAGHEASPQFRDLISGLLAEMASLNTMGDSVDIAPGRAISLDLLLLALVLGLATSLALHYTRSALFRIRDRMAGRQAAMTTGDPELYWHLITSSLYVELNRPGTLDFEPERFARLDKGYRTLADARHYRAVLRRDWEVTDEASLLAMLDWLLGSGHRALFDPPAPEAADRATGVSIVGWDMLRYGHLLRMAVIARLIDPQTGFRQLARAAAFDLGGMTSWDHLLRSWLGGYAAWRQDLSAISDYLDLKERMLTHPQSPYRQVTFLPAPVRRP